MKIKFQDSTCKRISEHAKIDQATTNAGGKKEITQCDTWKACMKE